VASPSAPAVRCRPDLAGSGTGTPRTMSRQQPVTGQHRVEQAVRG
jgi:hypothetical protein